MVQPGRYSTILGSISALRDMSPHEIGRRILPEFLKTNSAGAEAGASPKSIARAVGEEYRHDSSEVESLVMEGVSWALRTGLLIEEVNNGPVFLKPSRAGKSAIASHSPLSVSVADAEARSLMHPRIAKETMHLYERGQDSYTQAVAAAFEELEAAVREKSRILGQPLKTGRHGKDVFYDAMLASNDRARGALVPQPMHQAEAFSIRELFAGAYGIFRNPAAHRLVKYEDPEEVMRLLLVASALMNMLDNLQPLA